VVEHPNGIPVTLFDAYFGWPCRPHRLKFCEDEPALTGDLDIEAISRLGETNGYSLFAIGHNGHGGNLPLGIAVSKHKKAP
jgi:hypothetical protein